MNTLLSLNNIAWKTGALLFQDVGGVAKKFRGTNRTVMITDKPEMTCRDSHKESTENNYIPKDPRQAKRVTIALPVNLHNSKCITHDFSEAGVFIVSETPCQNGELIEFVISVDQLLNKLILRCIGKVIRRGKIKGKAGFAVKIASYILESEKFGDPHQPQH